MSTKQLTGKEKSRFLCRWQSKRTGEWAKRIKERRICFPTNSQASTVEAENITYVQRPYQWFYRSGEEGCLKI